MFCQRCGGYSFSRTVIFHSACKGKPSGSTAKRRLDRLMLGKHPVAGAFLSMPEALGEPAGAFVLDIGVAPGDESAGDEAAADV